MLLALGVLLAAACAGNQSDDESSVEGSRGRNEPLMIAAAASLTGPLNEIGSGFVAATGNAAAVRFSFDSSAALASQIRGGAPADVFAAADSDSMQRLVGEGLIKGEPHPFARNQLAIAVKRGNPRGVKGLEDLASAGIVALGGKEVPVGKYAEKSLASAGVNVPASKITRAKDSRAVANAVAVGDADVGIIFATDSTIPGLDVVSIPEKYNQIAIYTIAVLKRARNGAAAETFVEYVLSGEGQAVLRSAGFMDPA